MDQHYPVPYPGVLSLDQHKSYIPGRMYPLGFVGPGDYLTREIHNPASLGLILTVSLFSGGGSVVIRVQAYDPIYEVWGDYIKDPTGDWPSLSGTGVTVLSMYPGQSAIIGAGTPQFQISGVHLPVRWRLKSTVTGTLDASVVAHYLK